MGGEGGIGVGGGSVGIGVSVGVDSSCDGSREVGDGCAIGDI